MPGPPPKPAALRQRRNRTTTAAVLPSEEEALALEVPALPALGDWHPMVIEWWRAVWTSPMAAEYLEVDKQRLYKIAVLHHEFWRVVGNPEKQMALLAEIRQQEAPLGLTPMDRRRLQWEVGRGEDAAARVADARQQRKLKGLSTKDPRDILKAIQRVGVILFPPVDEQYFPTLGPYVCQFIEENLVHGPGDLFERRVRLNDEIRAWIYRMYEVEPQYLRFLRAGRMVRRKNPRAGRRRFERCVLSLRKGSSKTELAAWIVAAELHEDGPVRCAGFGTVGGVPGQPLPRAVTDPYIPMISYTEEQTSELAYGALRRILEKSAIAEDFDIGLERIMRRDGAGKAEAVSSSPNARDGARTTFQHADETHRLVLPAQVDAWNVMLANLGKRPLADPWALETTTAPEPGAGSVAEATMDWATRLSQLKGPPETDPKLFFYHREAAESHDLSTKTGLREAIVEASGRFIAEWSDVDRIMRQFDADDADRAYLERVWLNRRVQATAKAFDVKAWALLLRPLHSVASRARITIGFDGSRYDDATGLVGTEIESGFQFVLGCWQRPEKLLAWEVPVLEVDAAVDDAFKRFRVVRMYCDPPKWEGMVAKWAFHYGEKRVAEWWTNRRKPMAYAIRSYGSAIKAGEIGHNGDALLAAHLGNCCKLFTNLVDEEEKPLYILRKERPDSPHKIDLTMAGILSWEARNDALAAGGGKRWRLMTGATHA